MPVQIKLRRDTAANWLSVNPILAAGEPGYETDTRKIKYGDGVSTWSILGYAITQADAGSLTGSTLPANITASSLTSVGTLTKLTVTEYINGSITGTAGSVTNGFYTNSSFSLGTTTIAVNRVSGAQSLTGISIDGSAGSAAKLSTARTINGVSFDGTAGITVTADASTLTGTSLASGVTGSSLTSTGTLLSVTSSGVISTTNTTNTNNNNASSGSITTAGGVAITKDLYVGQNAYIIGNLTVTGNIIDTNGNVVVQAGNLSVSGKETVGGINTKSFSVAMAVALA
jgi:hypothetical protein